MSPIPVPYKYPDPSHVLLVLLFAAVSLSHFENMLFNLDSIDFYHGPKANLNPYAVSCVSLYFEDEILAEFVLETLHTSNKRLPKGQIDVIKFKIPRRVFAGFLSTKNIKLKDKW